LTPEERFCMRVLTLSSRRGVPPHISAELERAVARFKMEAVPSREQLVETMRRVRQTIHQAHHEGALDDCSVGICQHIEHVAAAASARFHCPDCGLVSYPANGEPMCPTCSTG
jgi:hypothetical protein